MNRYIYKNGNYYYRIVIVDQWGNNKLFSKLCYDYGYL